MNKRNKSLIILAAVLGVLLVACAVLGGLYATKSGPFKTRKKQVAEKEQDVDPVIKNAVKYVTLADYKKIVLKKADIDKELQSQIDKALDDYAIYKKIKKGKVKKGDTVNIYYVGKTDGVAFDGGSCTKETNSEGYNLEIGGGAFIPGFEDALIGKQVGKTHDINVTFPESYSNNPDLAGKPAVFTVTINYKNGEKKPQKFNDAFVKKNLSEYQSAKDFKTQTRAGIIRSMAVDQVVNSSEIKEYPKAYMDAMEKQLRTSIEGYLSQQGMTLDDYLAQGNTTKEAYEEQLEKTAKENVGGQVIYNAIMQAENMKIDDVEYKTELDNYLKNYNAEKESDLDKTFQQIYGTKVKNIIYSDLIYNKVAEYLTKQVTEQ